RLHGWPRMHQRPQAALFQALRQLGYRIDSPNDKLPAQIHGDGPKPGAKCTVSIEESSQFASALHLCQPRGGWEVQLVGENREESPYVSMTLAMRSSFQSARETRAYLIDPDSSSGSYFFAAGWLLNERTARQSHPVTVARWPALDTGFQIDTQFSKYWPLPKSL